MSEEFYTRPILCVRDVGASINYYCEKLGFSRAWQFPPEDDKPIIAQVERSGLYVILDSRSVLPRAAAPSVLSMSLHAADKLGALHQEFKDRGAKITTLPFEVIWQKDVYQFDVEDLDGNVLLFWGDKPE